MNHHATIISGHRIITYDPSRDLVSNDIHCANHESFISTIIQGFIHPGDYALDIGAHIGIHTLTMAKAVGNLGIVTAFEPDPSHYKILQKNIQMNGYTHVTCFPVAVLNREGTTSLYRSYNNSGDNRIWKSPEPRQEIPVRCISLDSLMNYHSKCNFIKIDIQGGEVLALRGMRKLIEYQKRLSLIIEFWPLGIKNAGGSIEELQRQLHDFWLFQIKEDKKKISAVDDLGDLIIPGTDHFTNLLCVKKQRD